MAGWGYNDQWVCSLFYCMNGVTHSKYAADGNSKGLTKVSETRMCENRLNN